MRIMAIDYGDAHTGVAVSDPTGFLTGDVTTIHSRKAEVVLEELVKLVQTYQVDELVMGFPRNMDGTEGPRAELYREDIAVAAIDQEGVDRVLRAPGGEVRRLCPPAGGGHRPAGGPLGRAPDHGGRPPDPV